MVSDAFYTRWRSGRHIGPAKPNHRLLVRHGEFARNWTPWDGPTVNAEIWGESAARPWCATWNPTSDWVEVPNVLSINLDQDLSSRGLQTGTITIENVLMREAVGAFGLLYHVIERGGMSPTRGYRPPKSPFPAPPANEWSDVLVEDAQIFVYQGYGDALEPTFVGLIDKVDPTSRPDQITLSVRDFGKPLSDEHCLGYNIPKQIHEPIIFEPKKKSEKKVGNGAEASSSRSGYLPRFVTDGDGDTRWLSHDHTTEGNTEWVSIRLPQGRYTEFSLDTAYPGMEIYVGLNLKARKVKTSIGIAVTEPLRDGEPTGVGWVEAGLGDVPGGEGGWPYIKKFVSTAEGPARHKLGGEFETGDNTLLRIGFRKLHKVGSDKYRAGASSLLGIKLPPAVRGKVKGTKVITVNDVSDVVRCVLRWAGFKDWKVDDTGANLEGKMSFNRANTYMDVIEAVADASGFNFSMGPPIDEDSLGVPTFKETSVRDAASTGLRAITDQDLLTAFQPSFSDENKAYIIRVRGRGSKKGRMLGQDHVRQIMDVYRPPWSRTGRHLARIIKHVTHDDAKIKDVADLKVFSRMWALQMALEGATGSADIPGTPEFLLDEQLWLRDLSTGVQTRMWVSRRATAYQAGKNAYWKLTLGGSLVDTEDVVNVMRELKAAERAGGRKR